jgi:hypothetical protein
MEATQIYVDQPAYFAAGLDDPGARSTRVPSSTSGEHPSAQFRDEIGQGQRMEMQPSFLALPVLKSSA